MWKVWGIVGFVSIYLSVPGPHSGSAACDLPRVDASGLDWEEFARRGLRGRTGVVLTGLFSKKELARWGRRRVLRAHGNETFHADDTRGTYSFPRLADYVEGQVSRQMIFVSDSLLGMFGKAYRFAVSPPGRAALLRDFAESGHPPASHHPVGRRGGQRRAAPRRPPGNVARPLAGCEGVVGGPGWLSCVARVGGSR
ncbi:unnamed protein product, partial [Prorocentrum cordatum]